MFLFKAYWRITSKEHLRLNISVVPSLFQKTTWSYLVFPWVLCFFETSACSHPFFLRYWVKSPLQLQLSIQFNGHFSIIKEQLHPRILSDLLCFFITGVVARSYQGFFTKRTRTRTFRKSGPRTFRKSRPCNKINCMS